MALYTNVSCVHGASTAPCARTACTTTNTRLSTAENREFMGVILVRSIAIYTMKMGTVDGLDSSSRLSAAQRAAYTSIGQARRRLGGTLFQRSRLLTQPTISNGKLRRQITFE